MITSRLLKNAHLLRYPAASPTRRRGRESLLIRRDATPHPSPCQARGRLIAAYVVGNGLKPFPTKDFGGSRKQGFADSTCICLPARSRFGEGRGIFEQPEINSSLATR